MTTQASTSAISSLRFPPGEHSPINLVVVNEITYAVCPVGWIERSDTHQLARMSAAICGIDKAKTGMWRSLSSGAHSRDPLAHPGYACSEYPKIVFNNFGNRALMSASRTTLRCSTPFFDVWIKPASRKIRKWFDRVDLAMSGQGAASVQDMQSFRSSRLLTMRSRIGSASAASTPANVMSSRCG